MTRMTIDRIDCMFPILVTMLALLEILKCMKDCIMKGQGMLHLDSSIMSSWIDVKQFLHN